MISPKRQLNIIASPIKFNEYCLSGLKIVHNNNVNQVTEITNFLVNEQLLTSPFGNKLSLKECKSIFKKSLFNNG